MNLSFIALNNSGAETVQLAADKIRSSLMTLGRCDFRLCGSMAQVSSALSDAFANSDVIVVAAEPSVYSKAKLAILRAMHIKTQLNTQVRERIGEQSGMDSRELSLHCAMPETADTFLSEDGLFSGFSIKSGKQYFAMLPLDKLRLESQLDNGIMAYLAQQGFAPVESEAATESASESRTSCAAKAVEMLAEKEKKVYFADTPSCEMVKDMCGEDTVKDVFVFTGYKAERGDEAPRSYIADLARYAIPEEEDAFGAAVSNVYTGNSSATGERKYNIYVALADKSTSRVLRFVSQPGETPDELITASIELLMDMICEKCTKLGEAVPAAEEKPFVAEPMEEIKEELEVPDAQETKKKKGSAVKTVLFVLLAVILAAIGYFAYNGYENAQENKQAALSTFASYSQGAADESGSLLVFLEEITDYYEEETEEEFTTSEEESYTEITTEDNTTTDILSSITSTITATTVKIETTAKPTTTKTPATKPTTTKKPTTTAKPTTTKKPATTAKPTTTAQNSSQKAKGKFVFTVYGYGHGVGMSQEGALGYSRAGSSYQNILLHYYPRASLVKTDPDMPETVKYGGKEYPLVEYLCRSVVGEISSGCNSSTAEAFKAQTVAMYTYAKRHGFNIAASLHAFNMNYKFEGTAVETAVKSVLGVYLEYEGKPIEATFYAMSAGRTVKASTVWGRSTYPYLEVPVESPHDKKCAKYRTTYTISAEDFKELMSKTVGVNLSGNPAGWIKIEKHDSTVSSSVGYVERMTVGGKAMTGAYFRSNAMQYKIRSHCFSVAYMEE